MAKVTKQEAEEAAEVAAQKPAVPMVSIPKANAAWLLSLMDKVQFNGSEAKSQAAIVQKSLEQVLG